MKNTYPGAVESQPALGWLVPLVAVLALLASGAGLLLQGGDGPYPFTTQHGQEVEIYGRGVYPSVPSSKPVTKAAQG